MKSFFVVALLLAAGLSAKLYHAGDDARKASADKARIEERWKHAEIDDQLSTVIRGEPRPPEVTPLPMLEPLPLPTIKARNPAADPALKEDGTTKRLAELDRIENARRDEETRAREIQHAEQDARLEAARQRVVESGRRLEEANRRIEASERKRAAIEAGSGRVVSGTDNDDVVVSPDPNAEILQRQMIRQELRRQEFLKPLPVPPIPRMPRP